MCIQITSYGKEKMIFFKKKKTKSNIYEKTIGKILCLKLQYLFVSLKITLASYSRVPMMIQSHIHLRVVADFNGVPLSHDTNHLLVFITTVLTPFFLWSLEIFDGIWLVLDLKL